MKIPLLVQQALNLEGMTTKLGLLLLDELLTLSLEDKKNPIGFEFGTYKGRVSYLIAGRMQNYGWFHAVEQSDYFELEKIRAINERVTWHKERSEKFCEAKLKTVVKDSKVNFSHHDASHFFHNVKTELASIVTFMDESGVIVLDDFNDKYPQVRAAYYYLRYKEDFPFELILTGFNKAVLVHKNFFDYYENYILSDLLERFTQLGFPCILCRTDIGDNSRSFAIYERREDSETEHYGARFWGDEFYQKSHAYKRKIV